MTWYPHYQVSHINKSTSIWGVCTFIFFRNRNQRFTPILNKCQINILSAMIIILEAGREATSSVVLTVTGCMCTTSAFMAAQYWQACRYGTFQLYVHNNLHKILSQYNTIRLDSVRMENIICFTRYVYKLGLKRTYQNIRHGHIIQEHVAHEIAICCKPPLPRFTGDRKSLTDPQPTSTQPNYVFTKI